MSPSRVLLQLQFIVAACSTSFARQYTYEYASSQELALHILQYDFHFTESDKQWTHYD